MLDRELSLMANMAKQFAVMELQRRITDVCLGLDDASDWAYHTGRIFGEFMRQLAIEEKRLRDLIAAHEQVLQLPEKE
jgi:hypothetical protein